MIYLIIAILLSIPVIIIVGMNLYESTHIKNCWMVHYKTGKRIGPINKESALFYLGSPEVNYITKVHGLGKRTLYKYDSTTSWWD